MWRRWRRTWWSRPVLRPREDERAAVDRRSRDDAVAGPRLHAWAGLALRDRVVDEVVLGVGDEPADERDVLLLDGPGLEGGRERPRGLDMTGEHERAARAAIQPVERVNVLADGVPDAEHRDVVVVVPATMNQEPGRLVRHDDVVVDVEQRDRRHCGVNST